MNRGDSTLLSTKLPTVASPPGSITRCVGVACARAGGGRVGGAEPLGEPLSGQPGNGLQGARFLKEVRGARHDRESALGAQPLLCFTVQAKRDLVFAADDQQSRRADRGEP